MITIDTPAGVQTIFNNRDVIDIARTYISDDYASYIENKVVEFDEVEWRNAQEWASDYHAMEMENEEYRDMLYELKSQLEQITYEADKQPGLSKRKVLNKLDDIIDHLTKIL